MTNPMEETRRFTDNVSVMSGGQFSQINESVDNPIQIPVHTQVNSELIIFINSTSFSDHFKNMILNTTNSELILKMPQNFKNIFTSMLNEHILFDKIIESGPLQINRLIKDLCLTLIPKFPGLYFFKEILYGEKNYAVLFQGPHFNYTKTFGEINPAEKIEKKIWQNILKVFSRTLKDVDKKIKDKYPDEKEFKNRFGLMGLTIQMFVFMINESLKKIKLDFTDDKFFTQLKLEIILNNYGIWGPSTKYSVIQFLQELELNENFLLNIDYKFEKIKIIFERKNTNLQKFDLIDQEIINLFSENTISELIVFSCYNDFPTNGAYSYHYLRNFLEEFISKNFPQDKNELDKYSNKSTDFNSSSSQSDEKNDLNFNNSLDPYSDYIQKNKLQSNSDVRSSVQQNNLVNYEINIEQHSDMSSDWGKVTGLVKKFQEEVLLKYKLLIDPSGKWESELKKEIGEWKFCTKMGLYYLIWRIVEAYKK